MTTRGGRRPVGASRLDVGRDSELQLESSTKLSGSHSRKAHSEVDQIDLPFTQEDTMSTTTTRDPFRAFDRTFDRLFNEGLRGPSGSAGAVMPMDLYRSGETFVAHIDLPGVDPTSIDIDVEDRTLTVRADRSAPEVDNAQWLSRERPSGTFARQLSLGRGLALDQIEADYRDGVLTLTIPVAEEAKPRRISVSHSGGDSSRAIESSGSGGGNGSGGSGSSASDSA